MTRRANYNANLLNRNHPITLNDIYWLAGLLEGEGAFMTRTGRTTATIRLHMTDEDIVRRAAFLMSCRFYGPYQSKTKTSKGNDHLPSWKAEVGGGASGTNAVGWMMTLYSLMGARRKREITRALGNWRKAGRGAAPICHPSRKHLGRGLCQECYNHSRPLWRREKEQAA